MALSQTAKSNAFDELSLIQLIENEITRDHGVQTMEEALAFWRYVYRMHPLLKRWLQRDVSCNGTATAAVDETVPKYRPTLSMLATAIKQRYDVMLVKMVRTIPQSERLQVGRMHDKDYGRTLLHHAANSGDFSILKVILTLYPSVSENVPVESVKNRFGKSQTPVLRAVRTRDFEGKTVVHHAACSRNLELMRHLILLFPESERSQVLNMLDRYGRTVCVALCC